MEKTKWLFCTNLFFLLYPFLGFSNDPVIISLGENCRISYVLKDHNLKQHSYPFEWKITPFKALYRCLKEDFIDFYNPDYFVPYIDNESPVNKYGIVLAHDFPLVSLGKNQEGKEKFILDPDWRSSFPEIKEKYQRRIDRFRNVCLSDKKVFFIRYMGTSKKEAIRLREIISSYYPNLDFLLVCINHGKTTENWNLPKIKNYCLDISKEDTPTALIKEWKEIFIDCGILTP